MKKPLEFDCIASSQTRDTQGEMLDIAGADISHLEQGLGLWNDNHGAGAFNTLGRITSAKKIFKEEDCEDDRQKYYWEKVKPYIYAKGYMFDDGDHPNARAAAAILRNIHKADCPLKLKASVEGGVVARGIGDPRLLARTKITKIAITFTPANNATLVEPLNLDKSSSWKEDEVLIKSVMHLAKTNIPSFRHITRRASADRITENLEKIKDIRDELGLKTSLPTCSPEELIKDAVASKLYSNAAKINDIIKALTAGYGGASAPMDRTGGAVIQSESLDDGRSVADGSGMKHITCHKCGKEQVYFKHQTRCRNCKESFPFSDLLKVMINEKKN